MNDAIKYPWQELVLDAFLAGRDSLALKISSAEGAIAARLRDAEHLDMAERIALKDALRALQVLFGETKPRSERPDFKREDIA